MVWLLSALLAADSRGVLEGGNESADVDKTVFAIEAISEMHTVLDDLTELRDATEDRVRSSCLDTKRDRVEDLVNKAESASIATIDAIAAGEDGKAEHEFRKVGVALVRARQLQDEASMECVVGEEDEQAATQMGWSGSQ